MSIKVSDSVSFVMNIMFEITGREVPLAEPTYTIMGLVYSLVQNVVIYVTINCQHCVLFSNLATWISKLNGDTGPYKPRTGRTGQCMNHALAILAALV